MDSAQKWDAQAANYQSTYTKGENDYNGLLMDFLAHGLRRLAGDSAERPYFCLCSA